MNDAETFCNLKYSNLNDKILNSISVNVYINWAEEIIIEYLNECKFAQIALEFIRNPDMSSVGSLFEHYYKERDSTEEKWNHNHLLVTLLNLSYYIYVNECKSIWFYGILDDFSLAGKYSLMGRYEKLLITKLYEYDQNQLTKQCA